MTWARLYRKLFSKKFELLILGIIVILTTILTKVISVNHWIAIDWDMTSYDPSIPIIGLIWSVCGMLVLYIRKSWIPSIWFIFSVSTVTSLIMFWAIWVKTGLLWEVLGT